MPMLILDIETAKLILFVTGLALYIIGFSGLESTPNDWRIDEETKLKRLAYASMVLLGWLLFSTPHEDWHMR